MSTSTPPGARSDPVEVLSDDPWSVHLALAGPPPLREFNEAGVLDTADVHVARRLARIGRDEDGWVLLGAALAVRALRLGHVCVDLATVRQTVSTDAQPTLDLGELPWPDPAEWPARLLASPLVASDEQDHPHPHCPLRLTGQRLYLDRYWRQELQVAADLLARAESAVGQVDTGLLRLGLDRLFPALEPGPDLQRMAAATAVLRRLTVVTGGPGTGKTTTVARILALIVEQSAARGGPPPRVALTAPTGKAAARLEQAVHEEAGKLSIDPAVRAQLSELGASTIHRLLGWRPANQSRFRHDRSHRLPHDTVVVDETSMVSLSLMAKLVEAVRPDARLILVGDHEQLASVEAGAVLGDIVGPAGQGLRMRAASRKTLAAVTGHDVETVDTPARTAIGDGIIVLRRRHRFGPAISALADTIQRGDEDGALALLRSGSDDARWIELDPEALARVPAALGAVRDEVVETALSVTAAARAGDGGQALRHLGSTRVLCAHRRGPYGVITWNERIEQWLREADPGYGEGGPWYVGRPLLVTGNDYELQLYNGDTGVVVLQPPGRAALFERRGRLHRVSPTRLSGVETVHAMTVHKSQGSQFDTVTVILPEPRSPILTRQLLYTAVTRARRRATLVGAEDALRSAISRPIARASGLGERLWS